MAKSFVTLAILMLNCLAMNSDAVEPKTDTNPEDNTSQTTPPISEPNKPLLIAVTNAESSFLRTTLFMQPNLPPTTTRVLPDDSPLDVPLPNEQTLYLCPYPSLKPKISEYFKNTINIENCLYETEFKPGEPRRCESKPGVAFETQQRKLKMCDLDETKIFGIWGMQFCSPVIETPAGIQCYREGIRNFIQREPQGMKGAIFMTTIRMYSVCYDTLEKRAEWVLYTVKPSRLSRYANSNDYFYDDNINLPGSLFHKMTKAFESQPEDSQHLMSPQRLVPMNDDAFELWKVAISHYINISPLWSVLLPLIHLIDERIQRLSNRISRSVKVMTKSFYYQLDAKTEKTYLGDDTDILIPNIWCKQIYDDADKSGIFIVIHNTPYDPPTTGELCNVTTECKFQDWATISPAFDENIIKNVTPYAYCCEKVKFSTFEDVVEHVIQINFEANPVQAKDSSPSPPLIGFR